jgi:hypothetical protein
MSKDGERHGEHDSIDELRRTILKFPAVGLMGFPTFESEGPIKPSQQSDDSNLDNSSWTRQAKLAANEGKYIDIFGAEVALSGDTALIGNPTGIGLLTPGSAHVFTLTDGEWTQQEELRPDDVADLATFGEPISLSEDTALVGGGSVTQGWMYVFTRTDGQWTQRAKLRPDNLPTAGGFGDSAALSGDTALIGYEQDNTPAGENTGSVYVYTRTDGEWTPEQKLFSDDLSSGDKFGTSVTLTGDTALIGSTGSTYVFTQTDGEWTQQERLPIGTQSRLDKAVAPSGDTALIGSGRDDTSAGENTGSAYVFTRTDGEWTQQERLAADDSYQNDYFGEAVALSGDTALIGAPGDNGRNGDEGLYEDEAGSVYVYTRTDGEWTPQQKLFSDDRDRGDEFGSSIALTDNTALIGSIRDDSQSGEDTGSAYVFTNEDSSEESAILDIDVKPVQTVFDTGLGDDDRLDLVTGKETAVLIYPGGENLPALSGDVTFELLAEGSSDALSPSDEVTISAEEYRSSARENRDSLDNRGNHELLATATGTGDKNIRVRIQTTDEDVEIAPADDTITDPVTNRSTGELRLAYFRITGQRVGYPTPSQDKYTTLRENSNDFVSATFPVASEDFSGDDQGDLKGNEPLGLGIVSDLIDLDFSTWKTDRGRGVGVVDPEYFERHSTGTLGAPTSGYVGITLPIIDSCIVSVGQPPGTAHELGHKFGLHTTTEEYNINGGRPDLGDGYWIDKPKSETNETENEYIIGRESFMGEPIDSGESKFNRWINNIADDNRSPDYRDYDVIFEQLENSGSSTSTSVSASSSDDVVYMKGLVYQDNSVDLSEWYSFESGALPSIDEGDYAAVVRDQDGTALLNRPFDVSFQLLASATEQIESPISTDVSGFSFPIRYPPEARSIQITKSGTTIAEVDPVAKLLRDAIDSIPEDDFRKKGPHDSQKKGYGDVAERRRKLLSDKVDAVARLLNQNDIHNAIHKLKDDLRPALKRWLKHHHGTTSPEQLTKEEIIQLVDRTINRLDQA